MLTQKIMISFLHYVELKENFRIEMEMNNFHSNYLIGKSSIPMSILVENKNALIPLNLISNFS